MPARDDATRRSKRDSVLRLFAQHTLPRPPVPPSCPRAAGRASGHQPENAKAARDLPFLLVRWMVGGRHNQFPKPAQSRRLDQPRTSPAHQESGWSESAPSVERHRRAIIVRATPAGSWASALGCRVPPACGKNDHWSSVGSLLFQVAFFLDLSRLLNSGPASVAAFVVQVARVGHRRPVWASKHSKPLPCLLGSRACRARTEAFRTLQLPLCC